MRPGIVPIRATKIKDYTLSNFELEKLLKKLPEFRGVFMRDTLPLQVNRNECTICNLDENKNDGTHWVLIYNSPKDADNIYYFDSFGVICPNEIEKYLRTSNKKIKYNTSQLQYINSTMCGYFCALIAYELHKGRSFYDCVYLFKQFDGIQNEDILKKYFNI